MPLPPKNGSRKPPIFPVSSTTFKETDLLSTSLDFSSQESNFSEERNPMAITRYGLGSARESDQRESNAKHKTTHTVRFASMPVRKTYPVEDIDLTNIVSPPEKAAQQQPAYTPGPGYVFPKHFKGVKLQEQEDWDTLDSNSENKLKARLLWFFLVVIFLVLLLGLILLVIYMTMKPHAPTVSLESLDLTKFEYIGTSSSYGGPRLEAALNMTLRVNNSNKVAEMLYSSAPLVLYYENQSIGNIVTPPFAQHSQRSALVSASLPLTITVFQNPETSMTLARNVMDSNVPLTLKGNLDGRYRILKLLYTKFTVPIVCAINVRPSDGQQDTPKFIIASCYRSS